MNIIGRLRILTAIAAFVLIVGFVVLPATPTEVTRAQEEEQEEEAVLVAVPHRAEQGSVVKLAFGGFLPGERVAVWQTYPDIQTVVSLGEIGVNNLGNTSKELRVGGSLPTGRHYYTARGNESGRLAITTLDLLAVDIPVEQNTATVAVDISEKRIRFAGSGYQAREGIAIWMNLPDESVMDIGTTRADRDGNFEFTTHFDLRFPAGQHSIVAYGTSSERVGIVSLEIIAPPRHDDDDDDDDDQESEESDDDDGDDDDDDDDDN